MTLLACFLDIVAAWQTVFPQPRSYLRAVRQALGGLVCLGRRTLSRILWTNGGQHKDWRADYFLFSRSQWNPTRLFHPIVQRALPCCPGRYIGVAIDDTRLRKTGGRIHRPSSSAIRSLPSFMSTSCSAYVSFRLRCWFRSSGPSSRWPGR